MESNEAGKEKAPETSDAIQTKEVTRATAEPQSSPPTFVLSHEYYENNHFYYSGRCHRDAAQFFINRLEQLDKRARLRWCHQRLGGLFWLGEGVK